MFGIVNIVESSGSVGFGSRRFLPHLISVEISGEKWRDGNTDKEGQHRRKNDFKNIHGYEFPIFNLEFSLEINSFIVN